MTALDLDTVVDLLMLLDRHTVPAGGQRALSAADRAERAADWLLMLDDEGVTAEQLIGAVRACIRGSRWRPELADIMAHITPTATREDVATTAMGDLAYLLDGYRVCGSIDALDELERAILPNEGQPLMARPVVTDVQIPDKFMPRFTTTERRRTYPPCPADLADRHRRIRAALGRIGGLGAVREAMRAGERPGDSQRALEGLGHTWRSVYASNASEAQREASPGLRVIEGGKRGEAAMLARQDERDTGRMVQAIADAMRGPR